MSTQDLYNYMAGLIDGEGCFLLVRKGASRPDVSPVFRIDLRADDRDVLDQLCAATGVGRVKIKRSPSMQTEQAVWDVTGKTAARTLVEILDKHPLRAKKRADYAIWREFVLWSCARKHGDDWSFGQQLRQQLNDGRKVRSND